MKSTPKQRRARALIAALLCTVTLCACGGGQPSDPADAGQPDSPPASAGEVSIALSDGRITVDGEEASQEAGGAVYLSRDIHLPFD